MKAMRVHRTAPAEESPLVLDEVPVPSPAPGELLVRVEACGVCRTDLHVVEGDLPAIRRPLVPGHMIVGTVEELGPPPGAGASAAIARGVRVGAGWLSGTCGACGYCAAGRENLCAAARFTGYHVDGGYAEYVTVPALWAYPLPAGLSAESAAPLLCAGIIGYRALALSGVGPGERLGLYGFGNSAHLVLQIARARGIEVHVASRGGAHRALALEMGAAAVAAELPPESLHAAILFAPAGELVPPALRALRRGGTLACAGIHMSPIPALDYATLLFGERVLRSVTAYTRADGRGLLAEAARLGLRPRTTSFPLAEANAALQALKADRIRGAAVLAFDR
ncbi:MAG: zinc-dependent alcohol dehydrogenase family protein [Planctomycetota bacterium]